MLTFAGGIANVGLILPSLLMLEGTVYPFERGGLADILIWVVFVGAFVAIGLAVAAYNRKIKSVGLLIVVFSLISGISSIISGNTLIALCMGIALVGGIVVFIDATKKA